MTPHKTVLFTQIWLRFSGTNKPDLHYSEVGFIAELLYLRKCDIITQWVSTLEYIYLI